MTAAGRPPAQATFRAASHTALIPPRRGSSQVRRPFPSSDTAIARRDGVSRTTAASPPGGTTVPDPTSWSYCLVTHLRLAPPGDSSSARSAPLGLSTGSSVGGTGSSARRAGRARSIS